MPVGNDFGRIIANELSAMQSRLFEQAADRLSRHTIRINTYDEMKQRVLNGDKSEQVCVSTRL